MELLTLFDEMLRKGASDMHIRANSRPYLRIDGDLHPIDENVIVQGSEIEQMISGLMNEGQKRAFYSKYECDLAVTMENKGRFRINVYKQRGELNIAIRHVPIQIPTIEQLGLPNVIKKLAENDRGLVLVTGPTGCGKSSTLASMIDHVNTNFAYHIITIEDPLEFIHNDKKSIISQRELNIDTLNYPEALKNVVRQDPDVVLIGEMRDLDTMQAAMTAAQLGHFVLSTIHTIDTIQTVSRVVDMFPPHQQTQIRYQFADTLKGIISQRLIPKANGKGLVPAVEVLVATPIVKKYIEENNLSELKNIIKQGQYYGMQMFDQAILKLYQEGKIKLEDGLAAATSPEDLLLSVRGIQSSVESATVITSGITLERFDNKK
ncbi:MAG: PilT/PilU family type 4a pilus ATPase [Elusimicrobia bacterium]|nr:PilT/PilU family type 4a pilus ATPase [Elusimicrobiota bacterium]MBU2613961.1 PilT/PilU family type 4a pilus ATPase [Elusimicrobiota bacterium]